jgi:hypothetical protein
MWRDLLLLSSALLLLAGQFPIAALGVRLAARSVPPVNPLRRPSDIAPASFRESVVFWTVLRLRWRSQIDNRLCKLVRIAEAFGGFYTSRPND